jgi:hypothetical protein
MPFNAVSGWTEREASAERGNLQQFWRSAEASRSNNFETAAFDLPAEAGSHVASKKCT